MKTTKLLAAAGVSSLIIAGLTTSTVYAWHPEGKIKKYVQNQTTNSQLVDADTADDAVMAKPGDTLRYVIEVKNVAGPAEKEYNDLYYTTVTDNLPEGVELVSDPAKRTLTADLGRIKPGEKKSVEYIVKVTSTKDGDLIDNKACFKGDSKVHDNKQQGCDTAKTKVEVPVVPPVEEPKQPEAPKETPKEEAPAPAATLPETGAGNIVLPAILASVIGYAAYFFFVSRRAAKQENN